MQDGCWRGLLGSLEGAQALEMLVWGYSEKHLPLARSFSCREWQTLLTALSTCWARSANGVFEHPMARSFQQTLATALLNRGPISNRSKAKLSNEVKSQTVSKPTSLHCKYIGKGQQFKRENEQNCDGFSLKRSPRLWLFAEVPPGELYWANGQEGLGRTWPSAPRNVAQQESGYIIMASWGKGKQFSKGLFLS